MRLTIIPSKRDLWRPPMCSLDLDMGQVGTRIRDLSGKHNHGTPSGTTMGSAVSQRVRTFNGTSDYVTLGDVLDFGTGDFSVEAWVKLPTGVGNNRTIVGKGSGGVVLLSGWCIGHTSSGTVQFRLEDPASAAMINIGTATDRRGAWWHVVGVADRNTLHSVYFNGALDATSATDSSGWDFTTTTEVMIGANNTAASPLRYCAMDCGRVRVYNRALASGEVARLYNEGKLRFRG